MTIGVIGGGASGMAAAWAASENPKVQVLLFERQARLGRKLLATGNGRCNLSNMYACQQGYYGSDPEFVQSAIYAFDPERTRAWFRSLGLYTVEDTMGKVYPYSDQANSVVDVLRFALEKPNVTVITGFEITKITKVGTGFTVTGGQKTYECDKVIVACGGLAGTKLGGSMAGYKLLAKLGHRSTRLRPSLVQLKTDWSGVVGLKGVRANCRAQILRNGEFFNQSHGELQFTEYGVSGPVIFDVSRDACYGAGNWTCRLDFLPYESTEALFDELVRRRSTPLCADELLTGILHNRLGRVLTKEAGIRGSDAIASISDEALKHVCYLVKNFEISLTEPMGMENAQVTAGGVLTEDFNHYTMESLLVPGLYACGEVLDVDGACGGYNLQWAWSSGHMAGYHAGKEET